MGKETIENQEFENEIWKFPLEIKDRNYVQMPAVAQILSVQMQNGVPCIWAMVDPHSEKITRTFLIYGTGHPISPLKKKYLGTTQDPPYVWHVFELHES